MEAERVAGSQSAAVETLEITMDMGTGILLLIVSSVSATSRRAKQKRPPQCAEAAGK